MSYFLAFFAFGVSSVFFLGRPIFLGTFGSLLMRGRPTFPGLSLSRSTTDGSYILVRPTFLTGCISKTRIWTLTVLNDLFNISAISKTVNSFIVLISVNIAKNFSTVKINNRNRLFILNIHLLFSEKKCKKSENIFKNY